jgi:hypothetical protein
MWNETKCCHIGRGGTIKHRNKNYGGKRTEEGRGKRRGRKGTRRAKERHEEGEGRVRGGRREDKE